jgi:hypothetical protein
MDYPDPIGVHLLDGAEMQLARAVGCSATSGQPGPVRLIGGELAGDQVVVHWQPGLPAQAAFLAEH